MDRDELQAVHAILQLIYHRNKNQHQRAKWWRWLSMLKRTTLDLASPTLSSSAAESYREHLAKQLIPKCYLAFSTVVADNQFSTLGIVLLATLGRLTKAARVDLKPAMRPQPTAKKIQAITPVEDRGERVSRGGDDAGPSRIPREPSKTEPKPSKKKGKTSASREKSSSKRKKNAIDDLFSGLL